MLLKTADHGQTWTEQPHGDAGEAIVKVAVATAQRATLQLSSGALRATTDGGASWRPVAALPEPPQDVCMTPDGGTFAVGQKTLYRLAR